MHLEHICNPASKCLMFDKKKMLFKFYLLGPIFASEHFVKPLIPLTGFTFTQLMSNFVSVSKNMSCPRGLKIEACGSSTASKTTVQEVKEIKNGSDLPHFHLCFTKLHISEARVCFSELKGLIWSISRTALFQCCCPRSHLSGKG